MLHPLPLCSRALASASAGSETPSSAISCAVAGGHAPVRHRRAHAAAGEHGKILRRRRFPVRFLAQAADNGLAERVLRAQLRTGGEGIQFFARQPRQGADHRRDLRRAVGQGAGLVIRPRGNAGKALQSVAFAHEKAMVGGVADGGHDRRGRGQHQRAGAEDERVWSRRG